MQLRPGLGRQFSQVLDDGRLGLRGGCCSHQARALEAVLGRTLFTPHRFDEPARLACTATGGATPVACSGRGCEAYRPDGRAQLPPASGPACRWAGQLVSTGGASSGRSRPHPSSTAALATSSPSAPGARAAARRLRWSLPCDWCRKPIGRRDASRIEVAQHLVDDAHSHPFIASLTPQRQLQQYHHPVVLAASVSRAAAMT